MSDAGALVGASGQRWYQDAAITLRLAIYLDPEGMRQEVQIAAQHGWAVLGVDGYTVSRSRPLTRLRWLRSLLGIGHASTRIAVTYRRLEPSLPEVTVVGASQHELRALEQLFDGGHLTPDEFEAAKARVLRLGVVAEP